MYPAYVFIFVWLKHMVFYLTKHFFLFNGHALLKTVVFFLFMRYD